MSTGTTVKAADDQRTWAIGIDIRRGVIFCAVVFSDFVNCMQKWLIRKFRKGNDGMNEMRDWLLKFKEDYGPTVFVVESAGTYHRSVCYALEKHFDCILINSYTAAKEKCNMSDSVILAFYGMALNSVEGD